MALRLRSTQPGLPTAYIELCLNIVSVEDTSGSWETPHSPRGLLSLTYPSQGSRSSGPPFLLTGSFPILPSRRRPWGDWGERSGGQPSSVKRGEAPAAPAAASSPTPHSLEWVPVPAPIQLQESANPYGIWAEEPGTEGLGYWEIIEPQGTGKVLWPHPSFPSGRLNKDPRP